MLAQYVQGPMFISSTHTHTFLLKTLCDVLPAEIPSSSSKFHLKESFIKRARIHKPATPRNSSFPFSIFLILRHAGEVYAVEIRSPGRWVLPAQNTGQEDEIYRAIIAPLLGLPGPSLSAVNLYLETLAGRHLKRSSLPEAVVPRELHLWDPGDSP